jgi:GDPmannose 4,6-dehydratase
LADLLLKKDYEVYGVVRRASVPRLDNLGLALEHDNFHLVEGDITDPSSVNHLITTIKPDEYYNLAAQSHVASSFEQPTTTFNINTLGVLNALEAIRNYSTKTKFYQASTSEMFGQNYRTKARYISINKDSLNPAGIEAKQEKIQDEEVPFNPRSPYGVSKLAAHELVKVYRESYGIFACCGILFNHESERRGHNFVTRKITRWLGEFANRFKLEIEHMDILDDNPIKDLIFDQNKLRLGNLAAIRDWGHAEDYVKAMYLMLQQERPDDYVIATGEGHTVEDFLKEAFAIVHPDLDYRDFVVVDPKFYRPAEVDFLCGHAWKARQQLGWKPKIEFKELVRRMVTNDIEAYSG